YLICFIVRGHNTAVFILPILLEPQKLGTYGINAFDFNMVYISSSSTSFLKMIEEIEIEKEKRLRLSSQSRLFDLFTPEYSS
ncbi:hypothetical protein ACJX0J_024937, partial [Zea mays]